MRELLQKILFSTISIAILSVMVIYLAGCAGNSSEVVSIEPSLSNAASVVEVANVEPTIEPTVETAVITPTAEIDHCLDCHINKELLIDTADPEEEVINENEGKG
ncbi:MAG: hypothetical protein GY943_32230 [Chloroflexi bacterium]|nr:hypothetical protein [Chloroflexota bacterium]